MLILTDLGHDPDDCIAISYLIEHGVIIESIILSPGFDQQVEIAYGLIRSYGIDTEVFRCQDKQSNKYSPGNHSILMGQSGKVSTIDGMSFTSDQALVIGPAKNLGGKLSCREMYFQGGYSPNSISPLEKFSGQTEVQSYNPSGGKTDFNLLLESQDIQYKRYVGKNVCHGYTREQLKWHPKNQLVRKFYDKLSKDKAMHDVLAAKCLLDPSIGIWEQAKPKWVGAKMTTESTLENIHTLIGLK